MAPFGARARSCLAIVRAFFSKEGSVVLHDELANPARQRVLNRGQLAASRSETEGSEYTHAGEIADSRHDFLLGLGPDAAASSGFVRLAR